MDVSTVLYAGLFGLVLAGATFGACYWWYGRRVREMLARMEKLEVSRQTSTQHAQQARKQVEALQKELAAQRDGRSSSGSSSRNREAMEATLRQEAERQSGSRRDSASSAIPASGFAATQIDPPSLPVNGFAETVPMCVRPGSPA